MGLLATLRQHGERLRQEVADSGTAAVYVRQLLRGNRQARPVGAPAAPHARPILLIHGYLATRGSLHLLERRLEERGHTVFTYHLGLINLRDIRDSAGLIARKVESMVAQTGVEAVDIVGHSMGGLVGLYYIKRLGGRRRVRRLVMLGTPIRGTWSALFGLPTLALGRASLQLLPGSPFLRELEEGELPPGVDVMALAGSRDWLAPVGTTVLRGIRHLELPTSHSGLLVEEAVADVVDRALRAQNAPDRPEGLASRQSRIDGTDGRR